MTLASSDSSGVAVAGGPQPAVSRTPSDLTAASHEHAGKRAIAPEDEPLDLVQAREKPTECGGGRSGPLHSAASSGETLVTDDERAKVPPFCELKKVVTPKGELIYVGWDGPDDPKNPRNVSYMRQVYSRVALKHCLPAVAGTEKMDIELRRFRFLQVRHHSLASPRRNKLTMLFDAVSSRSRYQATPSRSTPSLKS